MGVGSFFGLEIGKRGVSAHQQALQVTGHNITNAETKGYSRQIVSLKALDPLKTAPGAGQVGTGVTLSEIERIRDNFLDAAFREQQTFQGETDALAKSLESLQTILNEPSDKNIRASLDELFQAIEDVNNQPENQPVRVTLVEKAKSLATMVNVTYKRLQESLSATNAKVQDKFSKINSIAESIANLNLEISKARNIGQNPNDVLDERDRLLDELASLANVEIREDLNQELYVTIGEHLLVQGKTVRPPYLVNDPNLNGLQVISSTPTLPEPSDNPKVATAWVGADAKEGTHTVTVFQTATKHSLQSVDFRSIQNDLTEDSRLSQAGILSGSFYLNGVPIYFDNAMTFGELRDTINNSGQGLEVGFEREKMLFRSSRAGTANQMTLSEGTSNFLSVMRFSDEPEYNSFGQVIFDGRVQDAIYAIDDETLKSSSNHVANLIEGVDVEFKSVGSTNIVINQAVDGGEIAGLLKYQDGFLQEQMRSLDKLAYAMTREFNKLHYQGFGLDGKSQRLFWKDFNSPFTGTYEEKGAAAAFGLDSSLAKNVQVFAAASGVFERIGDRTPVSSGEGDGSNASQMAQLKFAQVVDNAEYGLRTRLSVLNGGDGVDFGRKESTFVVSNGIKSATVSLEGLDDDSTLYDLQGKINDALTKNAIASQVVITTLADGRIRLTSNNENLTYSEGAGTAAKDLKLLPSNGASGNGSRTIETSALNAKFRGQPKSVTDFFAAVVADIGAEAEEVLRLKENTRVITTQIENQRLSAIGVSMDEELTNMIQFQKGYNASARIINVMDEILDTIINLGR